MLEHHFGQMAFQVEQSRHEELLALAARELRGAQGKPEPRRRGWRLLAGLGIWLAALWQRLAQAGDVRRPELSRWL